MKAIRWSTRIVAWAVVLMAVGYTLMMLSAGLSMGWSDRSGLQVAGVVAAILGSCAVTIVLAVQSIRILGSGKLWDGVWRLLVAVVPIPTVWLALNAGLFAP